MLRLLGLDPQHKDLRGSCHRKQVIRLSQTRRKRHVKDGVANASHVFDQVPPSRRLVVLEDGEFSVASRLLGVGSGAKVQGAVGIAK